MVLLFAASIGSCGPCSGKKHKKAIQGGYPSAKEVVDGRGESEKIFIDEEGREHRVVDLQGLHYRDEKGELVEIDARLRKVKGGYENRTNSVQSFFPDKLDTGVVLGKNLTDFSLRWNLDAMEVVLPEDSKALINPSGLALSVEHESTAVYQSKGVPIRDSFEVRSGLVEHRVVLEEQGILPDHCEYTLRYVGRLRLADGLELLLDGRPIRDAVSTRGSLAISSQEGGGLLRLQEPVVRDNRNAEMLLAFEIRPTSEGEYILGINAPGSWLCSGERDFPVTIDPTIIDIPSGEQHYTIYGSDPYDAFSGALSEEQQEQGAVDNIQAVGRGDLDADGNTDLVVAAPFADGEKPYDQCGSSTVPSNDCQVGEIYIFLGKPRGNGQIDLRSDSADVRIIGPGGSTTIGLDIAVGDIDLDGSSDLVFNIAPPDFVTGVNANTPPTSIPERIAVIFGGVRLKGRCQNTFPCTVDLHGPATPDVVVTGFPPTAVDPFTGWVVKDSFGSAVSVADITGDGKAELIIDASSGSGPSNSRLRAGEIYILNGGSVASKCGNVFPCSLALSVAPPDITMFGIDAGDARLGSVGEGSIDMVNNDRINVGDVNGDGMDDLMIGATGGKGPGNTGQPETGELYVLFGGPSLGAAPTILDLAAPPLGIKVTTLYGHQRCGEFGRAATIGDLNGDHVGDLAVGAPFSCIGGQGEIFVFYGRTEWPGLLDLAATLSNANVHITGEPTYVGDLTGLRVGRTLASGDVNKDGTADLIIGTSNAAVLPGEVRVGGGMVQVLFGRADFPPLINLDSGGQWGGTVPDIIVAGRTPDRLGASVTSIDFNLDGVADLVGGAPMGRGPARDRPGAGEAYVVYGLKPPPPPSADTIPPNIAVRVQGGDSPSGGEVFKTEDKLTFVAEYDDGQSGVDTGTFSATLDGQPLLGQYSVTAFSASIVPSSPIPPGTHQFSASIKDNAGNPNSATGTFTIVQPTMTITLAKLSPMQFRATFANTSAFSISATVIVESLKNGMVTGSQTHSLAGLNPGMSVEFDYGLTLPSSGTFSGNYVLRVTASFPVDQKVVAEGTSTILIGGNVDLVRPFSPPEGDIAVPIRIENTGNVDTFYTAEIGLDGQIARKEANLAAGANRQDSYSFQRIAPGNKTIHLKLTFKDGTVDRVVERDVELRVLDVSLALGISPIEQRGTPAGFTITAKNIGEADYAFRVAGAQAVDGTIVATYDRSFPLKAGEQVSDVFTSSGVTLVPGTLKAEVQSSFPIDTTVKASSSVALGAMPQVTVDPEFSCTTGADITVPVEVKNTGNIPAPFKVEHFFVAPDGQSYFVRGVTVQLDPGQTTTVSFQHSCGIGGGSANRTRGIVKATSFPGTSAAVTTSATYTAIGATLDLVIIISPSSDYVDKSDVNVPVSLKNTGTVPFTYVVDFQLLSGSAKQKSSSRQVYLQAGEARAENVAWGRLSAGTYTMKAKWESTLRTVEASADFSVEAVPIPDQNGDGYTDTESARALVGPGGTPTPTQFGTQDYAVGNNSLTTARTTGDPVDVVTGNLSYIHTDLIINSRIFPLELTRAYNSRSKTLGVVGLGWTFRFDQRLVMEWDFALVEERDFGTRVKFLYTKDHPNVFVPEFDGDRLIDYPLDQGTYHPAHESIADRAYRVDANNYVIESKHGLKFIYNGYLPAWVSPPNPLRGRLKAIEDPNRNRLELTYDESGLLIEVRDPSGDSLRFYYTGTLITSVCDHGGRCVGYLYDNRDRLIRVTDPAGRSMFYAYDHRDNLSEIRTRAGDIFRYEYDEAGRCTGTIEARGIRTSYAYHAASGLTIATDPKGYSRRFLYDSIGVLVAEIDELGQATFYSSNAQLKRIGTVLPNGGVQTSLFDARGNLLTATDTLGRTVQFEYRHPLSRPTKVIDPAGQLATMEYDASGNLLKSIDATGATMTYAYNSRGQVVSLTDPRGNVTQFTYDAKLRLVETRDPQGNVRKITYDSLGRVTQATDPLAHMATLSYDVLDNLLSVSNPLGHSTSFAYDAHGQITSITRPAGGKTTLRYVNVSYRDAIAKITNPVGASYSFGYDSVGNLTTITDAAGRSSTLGYDALRRVVSITDPMSYTRTRSYDLVGNLTELVDANGHKITYAYDLARQLLSVTDALNQVTAYTYDVRGNLVSAKNPRGAERTFEYDVLSRMTAATDPLGQRRTFQYDVAGNLTSQTTPDGKTTTFAYDTLYRLVGKTLPDGSTVSFAFDVNGNLTRAANAIKAEQFLYDAANRLVKVADETTGDAVEYAYDADGNRTSLKVTSAGSSRSASYTFDPADRLTKLADPEGRTYGFQYDSGDRLTQIAYPNTVLQNRSYDNLGRLASIENITGSLKYNAFNYDYDPEGNVTRITEVDAGLQSVGMTQASYDALDRITRVDYPKGQWLSLWAQDINLAVQKMLDQVPDDLFEDWENGQTSKLDLLKLDTGFDLKDLPTPNLPEFVTYAYDAAGNRTQMTRTISQALNLVETHTYTYNPTDQLTQLLVKGAGRDFKTDFAYDARGNMVQKAVTNNVAFWENFTVDYSYDFENRLTQVKSTKWGLASLTPHLITYQYDALGRRVNRSEGVGTLIGNAFWEKNNYTYDGLHPVRIDQQYFGDLFSFIGISSAATKGTWYNRAGDLLLSQQDLTPFTQASVDWAGTGFEAHALRHVEFVHPDHLDSTTMITNWKGQAKNQYRYDVFGDPVFQRPYGVHHRSKFLFNSQEWDGDAQLAHFYGRDYDPELGRFLSQDVIPDSNRYAYARNNPMGFVDPLGLWSARKGWKSVKSGAKSVGGAIGDAAGAVGSAVGDAGQAVGGAVSGAAKAVSSTVADAANWSYDHVIEPIGEGVVAVTKAVGEGIAYLGETIYKAVLDAYNLVRSLLGPYGWVLDTIVVLGLAYGGMLAGAFVGGLFGSLTIPGLGTLTGAQVGGLIGLGLGFAGGFGFVCEAAKRRGKPEECPEFTTEKSTKVLAAARRETVQSLSSPINRNK